jgi:hypothetical protein
MVTRVDHSVRSDDRILLAINVGAGNPGWPGRRMSTEGW